TILDQLSFHQPTYKEVVAAIAESVFIGSLSLHNNNVLGNLRTATSRSLYVNSLGNYLAWQRSEFAGPDLVDPRLAKFLTFTIQSHELAQPRLSKVLYYTLFYLFHDQHYAVTVHGLTSGLK